MSITSDVKPKMLPIGFPKTPKAGWARSASVIFVRAATMRRQFSMYPDSPIEPFAAHVPAITLPALDAAEPLAGGEELERT